MIAGGLQRLHKATTRMAVTPNEIEERLAAARHVFDDVDLFVAPSRFMAVEFERFGIAAAKVKVSDYGFAPQTSARRMPRARATAGWGTVGTLVWHKGVHVLIDAVRALPPGDVELRIFGEPGVFPAYSRELKARAAGLSVRFEGSFDRHAVADVYGDMDVLVVPSLWLENSPLVIHEAFTAGVPVVASRMGGIVDLVRDGDNGLLYEATSPEALANALRSLIEQPGRLAQLAARVQTTPPAKTIADDAREWTDTYSELVARRSIKSRS